MNYIILLPIILAVLSAFFIRLNKCNDDAKLSNYAIVLTTIISLSILIVVINNYNTPLILIDHNILGLRFNIDGLTIVFCFLIGVLWPIASYWGKTYMKHVGRFKSFYFLYLLSYASVIGLAFSGNMFTMYIFYELITFATLPLVMFKGERRDKFAASSYIYHMFLGAALGLMGMIIFANSIHDMNFTLGGIIHQPLTFNLLIAYLLMFVGFAVKTGIFPFHKWILQAGVAPTTVTALLHAVAVVKAGAFATMRVTYYLYDPSLLHGTFVQYILLILISITIIFGSFMALKSTHLKRRLAYSTVSQLSYILLGVISCTTLGLQVALLHMIFHGFTKIVLFYCVGNIMYTNHKEYTNEIYGYGYKMKTTMICFLICGICLIGIPPFGLFTTKFALANASMSIDPVFGFIGLVTLIISALLTAMYILDIIIDAYYPNNTIKIDDVKSADPHLRYPLIIICSLLILLSLASNYIYNFIGGVI